MRRVQLHPHSSSGAVVSTPSRIDKEGMLRQEPHHASRDEVRGMRDLLWELLFPLLKTETLE